LKWYYGIMSVKPECRFCRINGLLSGEVFIETDGGFVVRPQTNPESYLVVPNDHAESLTDLPDDWWHEFKKLVQQIPDMPEAYNLSINIGKSAGQTMSHLHFWVIPRYPDKPSSGKGLARLIIEADENSHGE
jgi:diadenosine tetraphosphate (Ap4A) HIT family hydrolase